MNGQAFDEKNQKDFDRNTDVLAEGIIRIGSDSKLKATVAELSRITGIHRNTIRQRKWPLQRLEAIKDSRRLEVLAQRVKAEKKQDPKTVLINRLEKSRLEVIYWFNKYQDAESTTCTTEKRLNTTRESRDYYVKLSEEQDVTIKRLEAEMLKLRDALNLISTGLEESK